MVFCFINIIIIIIWSIPRRAFQYLFINDTFNSLISVYKNNYKIIYKMFKCSVIKNFNKNKFLACMLN
jgi:hypothetical protein